MKNCLRLCMMLFMLTGFSVGYAASAETINSSTYTIVKGDVLSAIAKKFPGTTSQALAQANNIANQDLILPNTILRIPQTKTANSRETDAKKKHATNVKLSPLSRTTSAVAEKRELACDAKRGLDQLEYPNTVRTTFESAQPWQNEQAVFTSEQIYFASQGGSQYVFQISKHCIFTKFVQANGSSITNREPSDRSRAGVSTEIDTIPPPELTSRKSLGEQWRELSDAIKEVLGPSDDRQAQNVALLTMALFRHHQQLTREQ